MSRQQFHRRRHWDLIFSLKYRCRGFGYRVGSTINAFLLFQSAHANLTTLLLSLIANSFYLLAELLLSFLEVRLALVARWLP